MKFKIEKADPGSNARAGIITTAHGEIATPIFMPVGTAGSVKAVHRHELVRDINAQIILGNTYHLFLRPGLETLRAAGGLHGFAGWERPMLTDSGGFQVFSLAENRRIKEEGCTFQSHIDGSRHLFTPERVMDIERVIGADMMMAFDVCAPGESDYRHAREAMETLTAYGISVYMCSGDQEARAQQVAEEAGIPHYRAQVMPQDKEDLVRQLQQEGRHVAMVGDGINDSQALAAADVSIAMGKGTDVAMEVAQVTLMGTDLRRIPDAIKLSKRTVGMIRQNLFWAFIYNIVCIPLAAGLPYLFGAHWQITPMWASALMAFSSVSVVLNSLRLNLQAETGDLRA